MLSGIFGIVRRDGAPVDAALPALMRSALTDGTRGQARSWSGESASLAAYTSDAQAEAPEIYDRDADLVFTAAARLDNRRGLIGELGLREQPGRPGTPTDADVLLAAYRRWGNTAPERAIGDWSFAAWHPRERRLFLARDHLGHGGLYYHADARTLAFAGSRRALEAVGLAPLVLDELYLAQQLLGWPAYYGERTVAAPIRRLAPAHALTVTPERLELQRYWRIEDVSELRLASRADYVEAASTLFDEAIESRIGSPGPVGVTLSGGLDSGAVAVSAARQLGRQGARVHAFTSVPLAATRPYVGPMGNELPLARATATATEARVEHHPLRCEHVSPLDGVRRALETYGEPVRAARNMFWIIDLLQQANAAGCRVLLTAQQGNAGISWDGDPRSQGLAYQLRRLGVRAWAKAQLRRRLPDSVLIGRARRGLDPQWLRSSAIKPAFARRLGLPERLLEGSEGLRRSPLERRLRNLLPARSFGGAIWAELGASAGVDVRDPTADPRVIMFALSVPDRTFIDPDTGVDRWLIREAMRGRLPDEVRLNPRRGRQAGDLVPRLRAHAAEVQATLDDLSAGPASVYLDVRHMRDVWGTVRREDTPEAFLMASTVLMRGIMAGLYVNSLQAPARFDPPRSAK